MPSGTVLHVDDSPEMRELAKRACSKPEIGLHYVGTDDGEEALRLIAAGTESNMLLLLDLHMPGMSGIEVLDALKQRGLGGRVRTIMLTSSTEDGDRENCLARGAAQYWIKPDDWRELMALMRRCADLLAG